jgi:D-alanyl-D-alanine dipeptidase
MLVAITPDKFDVILDIRYATVNNFVKKKLYQSNQCLLHIDAATKLANTIKIAKSLGLTIKIFDSFRPIAIQKKLWDMFNDSNFISNPSTGSVPHCRGVAIDLTLTDQNHQELDMGTAFDHFSQKSFHGNIDITIQAQKNRLLLLGIMTQAGWDFYQNEWWHYQLFKPRSYEIIQNN